MIIYEGIQYFVEVPKWHKRIKRNEPMSMLSKDQIKQMVQQYDIKATDDIKDVFKDELGESIQEIMKKIHI